MRALLFAGLGLFLSMTATSWYMAKDMERIKQQREQANPAQLQQQMPAPGSSGSVDEMTYEQSQQQVDPQNSYDGSVEATPADPEVNTDTQPQVQEQPQAQYNPPAQADDGSYVEVPTNEQGVQVQGETAGAYP